MNLEDKLRVTAEECWLAIEGPWVPPWNHAAHHESDRVADELVRARDYVVALERLAAELDPVTS